MTTRMDYKKVRTLLSLAKALDKLAERADAGEVALSNGGILGSILGSAANDLRQQANTAVAEALVK